jgi:hypothetical protein
MTEKTAKNPITGDSIKTKSASKKYYNNYDLIFRKSKEQNNDKTNISNTNSASPK